jgi:hypothetical protein
MQTTIRAPADKVWETIRNFNGLPKFIAAITSSNMEGSGEGAVRTLTLQDSDSPIVERLERLDYQARILSYSIVESPLPLEDYIAIMEVRELDKNQCELKWSSTFEPQGVPEAEAIKIVEGVYSMGFNGLKKIYGDE